MDTNKLASDYDEKVGYPARLATDAACDHLLALLRTAIAAAPITVRVPDDWYGMVRALVDRDYDSLHLRVDEGGIPALTPPPLDSPLLSTWDAINAAEDAVIDRCQELAIARRRLKTSGGDR